MVLTGFIEIPLIITVSVIFFVFLLFSYIGGLWAVTFTDFIQLVLGLVVSEMGLDRLSDMSDLQKELANDNLTEESLGILRVVKKDVHLLSSLVKKEQVTSLKLSTILAKLIRAGYLIEKGFWKRNIEISKNGNKILEKHEHIRVN